MVDQPSTSLFCIDTDYVLRCAEQLQVNVDVNGEAMVLIANEVDFVLKQMLEKAVKFAVHARRRRLCCEDVDAAFAMAELPPSFGFNSRDPVPFRWTGSGGRDVFVVDDKELELNTLLNVNTPKLPLEVQLKAHWLAIEGEQPSVPENPTRRAPSPIVKEEDPLPSTARGIRRSEQIQLKSTTTHPLSMEQQLYYKEILESCVGTDEGKRMEALHSLKTEPGLQALLPRFTLAIGEGVRCSIVQQNLTMLMLLMRMTNALIENVDVNFDRVLHELLPAILSCAISRRLCARPGIDDHWTLRRYASHLLGVICRGDSALETLFGAVTALTELGPDTVQAIVIPRVSKLFEMLTGVLSTGGTVEKLSAKRLRLLVTETLVEYIQTQRPKTLKNMEDFREAFGEGFGDLVFRAKANGQLNRNRQSGLRSSSPASQLTSAQPHVLRSGAISSGQQGLVRIVRKQPAVLRRAESPK